MELTDSEKLLVGGVALKDHEVLMKVIADPKMVPGPIAILLDDLGNFENFVNIWTRTPPNYYQNASTKHKKNYGIIFTNHIMFVISENRTI